MIFICDFVFFQRLFAFEVEKASLQDFCSGVYHDSIPTGLDGVIQMAEGLNYIHSGHPNNAYPRLRPESFFISSSGNIKIHDPRFKSGTKPKIPSFPMNENLVIEDFLGWKSVGETKATNVFSFVCVMYCFLTRNHPFHLDPASFKFRYDSDKKNMEIEKTIQENIYEKKFNLDGEKSF